MILAIFIYLFVFSIKESNFKQNLDIKNENSDFMTKKSDDYNVSQSGFLVCFKIKFFSCIF